MNKKKILLFTDLDGTLLNKVSFNYFEAKSQIKLCIEAGISIIPNSSKTDIELKEFCKEASISPVFISENGACIHGLNILNKDLNNVIVLSKRKEDIISSFNNDIDSNIRDKCVLIENLPKTEQIKILGLPTDKISKGLDRKYSIPMIFKGSVKEKKQLKAQTSLINLKIQDGGRVLNLGDNVSKGKAMTTFVNKLSKHTNEDYILIGIGDNQNDIDMLDKSDYPCLVKNKNIKENIFKSRYIYSEHEAPIGWNEVVKKTLKQINLDINSNE